MTSISDTNVVNAPGGLVELASTVLSVDSSIVSAGSNAVIIGPITAICDGSPILVEFQAPRVDTGASGGGAYFVLEVDGIAQGRIGEQSAGNAANSFCVSARLTPSAGSRTFQIRMYPYTSAAAVRATSATWAVGSCYLRVSKIIQASQLIVQTPNAPLVTSLPSNAIDGQEVRYLADNTNGIIWNFRYRAGSSSSYKWEFIGGTELNATGNGSQTTSNSFQTSSIPSTILPLAGDYIVEFGGFAQNSASGTTDAIFGLHLNSVAQSYAVSTGTTTYDGASVSRIYRLNSVTGNSTLDVRYRSSLSVNVAFNNIWLNVKPIRVSA